MNEVDFLINVICPAAQAAYLVMSVPPPPLSLPPGYTLVTTINADPPKAAAAMAQAKPDQQRLANEMVVESSIFGLIAWNASELTALVAIRGTKTVKDWIADIDAPPMPFIADSSAGLVHMGFQLVYEHIRTDIQTKLTANCAGAKRLLVTGHSLGGSLAVLCALDLAVNSTIKVAPELHSFAGPRTGDVKFAGTFDAAVPICNRVVNFMDVVPQIPVPPLYEHVGKEVSVHGGFRPFDITYAHHLTTYLTGLLKVQGAPAGSPPASNA